MTELHTGGSDCSVTNVADMFVLVDRKSSCPPQDGMARAMHADIGSQ